MHKDIDEIYRQMCAQQPDMETTAVWDRLEESLDLEQLWPVIDHSLTRYRRRKFAALTLVSLIIPSLAGIFYLTFSDHLGLAVEDRTQLVQMNQSVLVQEGNEVIPSQNPKSLIDHALSGSNQENNNLSDSPGGVNGNTAISKDHSRNSVAHKSEPLSIPDSKSLPDNEMPDLKLFPPATNSFLFPIPVRTFCLAYPGTTVTHSAGASADTNDRINNKKYYLNLSSGVKTTWLLNNHTYKSLQKESFEYLQRQYYPVASVGFGMLQNNKYSVEGNLVFLDFGGQHVNYLNEGRSIQLQTRLRYATLELIGGYHLKKALHPLRFNLYPSAYAGIYSSALLQSSVSTNELDADRNKSFRPVDFGVLCRIGFILPVREKLHLQAGLGIQTGIVNISRTPSDAPAYFDRSFNASGTAFFCVKYFLK